MRIIQTAQRPLPPGAPLAQTVANPDAAPLAPGRCSFIPAAPRDCTRPTVRYVPPTQSNAAVVRGIPTHVSAIVHLQKKFSNQLGFLPTKALEWYLENQHVGVAKENGEPVGYVLGRPAFKYQPLMRPITQAAVFLDAQRRHHGLALVNAVCEKAANAGQIVVQASCAADIDAVDFWHDAGFYPIGHHQLENARGREVIVFRRLLVPQCPDWFWTPPPRSGHRARRK